MTKQAKPVEGEAVEMEAVADDAMHCPRSLAVRAQPEESQALAMRAMTPMEMLSVAVQNKADMATLEKLMDLRDRDQATAARLAYSNAIVHFQAICPTVIRTGYNPRFGNQYPHWSSAHVQIKLSLTQCQLAVTHRMSQDENGVITVVAECRHGPSGHIETNKLSAPPDRLESRDGKAVRNEVQSIKSTITYLECVTAFALLGLDSRDRGKDEKIDPALEQAIDRDDDDGNSGKTTESPKAKSQELVQQDPAAQTVKQQFVAACRTKAGDPNMAMPLVKNVYMEAVAACGSPEYDKCLAYIQREDVTVGKAGTLGIVTSEQVEPDALDAMPGTVPPVAMHWRCLNCNGQFIEKPAGPCPHCKSKLGYKSLD